MVDQEYDEAGGAPPAEPQEAVVRTVPFADTLQRLRNGQLTRELADELQQLVGQVMDTGRAGALTLQLKVTKSKASKMIEIADVVAVKAPKLDRPVSMLFVDDDHNLSRTNPYQDELPGVRAVPAQPPAVKRVGE